MIIRLVNCQDKAISLSLSGTDNYQISRKNSGLNTDELVYGRLVPSGSYRLTDKSILSRQQKVIPELSFTNWLDVKKLAQQNIGANGGMQLFEHQVIDGNLPQITLMAEPPQFGVFFDGTGNNKANDNTVQSDEFEPTNIAKLSELYVRNDYSERHYAEGIGTEKGKANHTFDMMVAHSFDERVNKALKEIRLFFKKFNLCKVGFIDIFGFSRGASQARMLVNIIHYFNQHQPDYLGGCQLMVRFLGIFYTVGSIGLAGDNDNKWHRATGGLPGSPKTVTLDIHPHSVCSAYHLTALDEQRKNFPLSSLHQQALGDNANTEQSHLVEQPCFGVHADVGGGYSEQTETIYYPAKVTELFADELAQDKYIQKFKAQLEQKYYKPRINIKFKFKAYYRKAKGSVVRTKHLRITPFWQRATKKDLAFVSLEKMYKYALSQGVPFNPFNTLSKTPFLNEKGHLATYDYQASTELKQLVNNARQGGTESTAYQKLYQEYIHHSHRYVGVKEKLANGIEKDPIHAFGHYGREVFYSTNSGLSGNENQLWQSYQDNTGVKRWFK